MVSTRFLQLLYFELLISHNCCFATTPVCQPNSILLHFDLLILYNYCFATTPIPHVSLDSRMAFCIPLGGCFLATFQLFRRTNFQKTDQLYQLITVIVISYQTLKVRFLTYALFFYKQKAYKHRNPQNWPKIKHLLSIY